MKAYGRRSKKISNQTHGSSIKINGKKVDAWWVDEINIIKKRTRQKAKQEIRKELDQL